MAAFLFDAFAAPFRGFKAVTATAPAVRMIVFAPRPDGVAPAPKLVARWERGADGSLLCRWMRTHRMRTGDGSPPD
jgi:hypothetical protein